MCRSVAATACHRCAGRGDDVASTPSTRHEDAGTYLWRERRDLVRGAFHGVPLLRYDTFLPPQGLVRFFLCLRLRFCKFLALFI